MISTATGSRFRLAPVKLLSVLSIPADGSFKRNRAQDAGLTGDARGSSCFKLHERGEMLETVDADAFCQTLNNLNALGNIKGMTQVFYAE
jgi:hypothetical protein